MAAAEQSSGAQTSTRSSGYVLIKPEYRLSGSVVRERLNEEASKEAAAAEEATKKEGDAAAGNGDTDTNKRLVRQKGKKKNNRKKRKGKEIGLGHHVIMLCRGVAQGHPERCCAPSGKPEHCRRTRDVGKYFAEQRPPAVEDECPIYEYYGHCPAGLNCRFNSCIDFERMVPKEKPEEEQRSMPEELNRVPMAIVKMLRKNEYPFERAIEAARAAMESPSAAEAGAGGEGPPPKRARTVGASEGDERISSLATPSVAAALAPSSTEAGPLTTERQTGRERAAMRGKFARDLRGKVYVAPLTTVGNLPFRRLMAHLGADITCGEMAVAGEMLGGSKQEWSLVRQHPEEHWGGIQIAGGRAEPMAKLAEVVERECRGTQFIDINMGCPLDMVCQKGMGSTLMTKARRLEQITQAMSDVMTIPLTLKMRVGYEDNQRLAHKLVRRMRQQNRVSAIGLHGRTRAQRYTKLADWEYIEQVVQVASEPMATEDGDELEPLPIIGNGDIFSFEDWNEHVEHTGVATGMLARGLLTKPWLPVEIKEQRHWDISSRERLDILQSFCRFGLEHWGADQMGIDHTRRFLLELLSFTWRYVPVGLLERVPQKINERPPAYCGRDDLETLMASSNVKDWIKISELLLGPVPPGFTFEPKHKANAFATGSAAVTDAAMTSISVDTTMRGLGAMGGPIVRGWDGSM